MIAQKLAVKTESQKSPESAKADLLRKIEVKKAQLQLAQEGDMPYVAEALQGQLETLVKKVNPQSDEEFQALMSLAED